MKKLFIIVVLSFFTFFQSATAQNEEIIKLRIQKTEHQEVLVPKELKMYKAFIQRVVEAKGETVKRKIPLITNFSFLKQRIIEAKYQNGEIIILKKEKSTYNYIVIGVTIFIMLLVLMFSRSLSQTCDDKITYIILSLIEIGGLIYAYQLNMFLILFIMTCPLLIVSIIRIFK